MEPNIEINDFENFNLKENLLRGIYSYGFETPSIIQKQSILPIMSKQDLIAQAPSGTGKTGSFGIGVLQMIDETLLKVQGILIAPTRELATQINSVIKSLGTHMNIETCLCIGGVAIEENLEKIKYSHLIVGTPGRISEIVRPKDPKRRNFKNKFDMTSIKILVMDEADDLLKSDFVLQIQTIIENIPGNTQICLYSATMPPDLLKITTRFLRNPNQILVKPEKLTLEGIKQYYVNVEHESYKLDTLMDLYKQLNITQSIIFVNTIDKCIFLYNKLTENNHTVSMIHGQLSPSERNDVMKMFRLGNCRILLATDILARGIDVQHVNMVINYDIPVNYESYLHRIGRSGRYGRKGTAINLATDRTYRGLTEIAKLYKATINELPKNIETI